MEHFCLMDDQSKLVGKHANDTVTVCSNVSTRSGVHASNKDVSSAARHRFKYMSCLPVQSSGHKGATSYRGSCWHTSCTNKMVAKLEEPLDVNRSSVF
ncbi:hypothetical protein BS78_08G002400 [Paspalum vaginatum]|nr:hypothetical protein BS78_08G002400 [Paspalum vaginatum]